MSKIKIRCNTCGKWFQSANAKEVTCPDCLQKARKEKLTARSAQAEGRPPGQAEDAATRLVPPPPPKAKPAPGGPSHWLDTQNDVKVGQPDQPRPKPPSFPAPRDNRGGQERGGYRGPGGYRDNRGPGGYRSSTPYRVGGGMGIPDTAEPHQRQPMTGGPNRGQRPAGPAEGRPDKQRQGGKFAGHSTKTPNPQAPPRPKREKIPPPTPFVPTAEQIAQVEARYTELAIPSEFDGIRTQISKELGIPKTAVRKIVKEYRDRLHLPSWWEAQTYQGNSEELEKIKAVYEPLLPVPPVGVHKQIAEQLALKPGLVYQAIKAIRQEMKLPQFNDPQLHGQEALDGHAQTEEGSHAQEQPEPGGEISSSEADTSFPKVDATDEVDDAANDDTNATGIQ